MKKNKFIQIFTLCVICTVFLSGCMAIYEKQMESKKEQRRIDTVIKIAELCDKKDDLDAADELLDYLDDDSEKVREQVLIAFENQDKIKDNDALEEIAECLFDENEEVRVQALKVLEKNKEYMEEEHLTQIIELLVECDTEKAASAIEFLANFENNDEISVDDLLFSSYDRKNEDSKNILSIFKKRMENDRIKGIYDTYDFLGKKYASSNESYYLNAYELIKDTLSEHNYYREEFVEIVCKKAKYYSKAVSKSSSSLSASDWFFNALYADLSDEADISEKLKNLSEAGVNGAYIRLFEIMDEGDVGQCKQVILVLGSSTKVLNIDECKRYIKNEFTNNYDNLSVGVRTYLYYSLKAEENLAIDDYKLNKLSPPNLELCTNAFIADIILDPYADIYADDYIFHNYVSDSKEKAFVKYLIEQSEAGTYAVKEFVNETIVKDYLRDVFTNDVEMFSEAAKGDYLAEDADKTIVLKTAFSQFGSVTDSKGTSNYLYVFKDRYEHLALKKEDARYVITSEQVVVFIGDYYDKDGSKSGVKAERIDIVVTAIDKLTGRVIAKKTFRGYNPPTYIYNHKFDRRDTINDDGVAEYIMQLIDNIYK